MRVIAGRLKGRRLASPSWPGLRPTSDRLREALFNVLAPRMAGARVLDLYAGTGALGIEAHSRGASLVVFVEQDRRAQQLIADNLAHCGVVDGCVIIRATAAGGLHTWLGRADFTPFDVVLLDPPYDLSPDAALAGVEAVVGAHGVVVFEHARRVPSPERAGALVRTRELRSGDSTLSFYRRPD